ncbi:hypothetical protein [Kouleothrix sp.]|uniref:hypothetical protein n=1 Tax=Kouleothrix sp. TaxID=2779161 RepID=UPI00391A3B6F
MAQRLALPCADLGAAYLAGQSTLALGRRYGCSPTTIANHLRACGVLLRPARYAAVALDEAALRRAYLDERRSIAALAAMFGVSPGTIANKRRRYGIPARPRRAPPGNGGAAA